MTLAGYGAGISGEGVCFQKFSAQGFYPVRQRRPMSTHYFGPHQVLIALAHERGHRVGKAARSKNQVRFFNFHKLWLMVFLPPNTIVIPQLNPAEELPANAHSGSSGQTLSARQAAAAG